MENELPENNTLLSPLKFSPEQFLEWAKIIIEKINSPKFFIKFRDTFYARNDIWVLWYMVNNSGHTLSSYHGGGKIFRINLDIFWDDYWFPNWGFTELSVNSSDCAWESSFGKFLECHLDGR